MSMDLEVKTYSTAPQYFEAGTQPVDKTTKTAAEDIAAHAPVALDTDGKLVNVTTANKDKVYGLLPEAAVAGEEVVVYLTGDFFADSLALGAGVTADAIELPMRNIGIFLK